MTNEGVEIRREPRVALFMDVPTDEGEVGRKRLWLGYERRQGSLGCINPEFSELPVGEPAFRVLAVVRS